MVVLRDQGPGLSAACTAGTVAVAFGAACSGAQAGQEQAVASSATAAEGRGRRWEELEGRPIFACCTWTL